MPQKGDLTIREGTIWGAAGRWARAKVADFPPSHYERRGTRECIQYVAIWQTAMCALHGYSIINRMRSPVSNARGLISAGSLWELVGFVSTRPPLNATRAQEKRAEQFRTTSDLDLERVLAASFGQLDSGDLIYCHAGRCSFSPLRCLPFRKQRTTLTGAHGRS